MTPEAAYEELRDQVFTLVREMDGALDDPREIDTKAQGCLVAWQLYRDRVVQFHREASRDDRESTVPPYLTEKAF